MPIAKLEPIITTEMPLLESKTFTELSVDVSNSPSSSHDFCCLVCHAHATGFHFNAQSCQACCAFFRRAISLNRKYLCHRREREKIAAPGTSSASSATQQCLIHYTQKVLCRACRLEKCLAIGMDKSAVQAPKRGQEQLGGGGRTYFTKSGLQRNKRFAKGALGLFDSNNDASSIAASAPCSISPQTPSSSNSSRPDSSLLQKDMEAIAGTSFSSAPPTNSRRPPNNDGLVHCYYQQADQQEEQKPQPSPIPPRRVAPNPKWDLLSLLVDEEMRIAERRRILFCERPVACLLGKNKFCPFTHEDVKPLRFQEFRRSIRTHILLVYEWLRIWPAYDELLMEDRVTLLRKCVLYHTVLDPCFLTIQLGDLSKFVLPNGGYVSTKYPPQDESWADEPEISHDTKVKIYWPLLVPLMSGCITPMLRLGLKFEEFVALKAIVSLQMTLPDISFSGRALVSRELESLCCALYKFYGSQPEFSRDQLALAERFGNLLLLLTPIIDTANTFVESQHIVQFFDLWQMDSLMLQFLKKKSC